MRLVTFERQGQARVGAHVAVEHQSFVLDPVQADPRLPGDMSLLLGAGGRTMDLARAAVAAADPAALLPAGSATLLPPLPQPGKIVCGREITEAAAMGLIAYLSQVMTLDPGDIIATGMPAKLPEAAQKQRFLRDGDVVTIMIGGLGALSNPVQAPVEATG